MQDRLVKEMRLDGVTGMVAGNAWLPGYIQRHNQPALVLTFLAQKHLIAGLTFGGVKG